MRAKILLIIMALFIGIFISSLAYAEGTCNIALENKSKSKIIYMVYWIDHDWRIDGKRWPFPVNVMGGELKPNETHVGEYKYSTGQYIVRWYGFGEKEIVEKFDIYQEDKSIRLRYFGFKVRTL